MNPRRGEDFVTRKITMATAAIAKGNKNVCTLEFKFSKRLDMQKIMLRL
jgi:GDP-D-mannose dehydratase